MDDDEGPALVLVAGGREVVLGRLRHPAADLGLVDAIARLHLEARRLGCSLVVRDPPPGLRELLELAGLAGLLAYPSRRVGSPKSAKRSG
ncbi:MAG TPA: hypothetical protein VGB14_16925 [Acidimicrobiales bacterium]|jgi:hypothetical protein